MSAKLIFDESIIGATSKSVPIPAGVYRSLKFRYSGTADTGVTGTKDEVGTVRYVLNGEETPVFTPARLWELNQRLRHGINRFSSAEAGAYEFNVVHPFHKDDGNVVHLGKDELTLKFEFTDPDTRFVSMRLAVWAEYGIGQESYMPRYSNVNLKTIAQRTELLQQETLRNLQMLLLVYSANHTNFIIHKGGNAIVDLPAAEANLYLQEHGVWQTYTAHAALVPLCFDFQKQQGLQAILHDDWRVAVISTDATFSGLKCQAYVRKEKTSLTAAMLRANRERRLSTNMDYDGVL